MAKEVHACVHGVPGCGSARASRASQERGGHTERPTSPTSVERVPMAVHGKARRGSMRIESPPKRNATPGDTRDCNRPTECGAP